MGKTHWALRWARARGAEIISCDSLLFYRGMDIGTAKPTAAERAEVPHHLVDVCEVADRMDVARYATLARAAAEAIWARGRPVLVCGGSGFYLQSFLRPVVDDVAVPAALRAEVAAWGAEEARSRLLALHPHGLGDFALDNPRRVARALERCLATGRTVAELAGAFAQLPPPFPGAALHLTELGCAPDELAGRLAARAEAMVRAGLVAEVEALRAAGLAQNPSAAGAIGYREVLACLAGDLPRAALAAEIAKNSRALAKKQRTWFRTQLPAHHRLAGGGVRAVEDLFPP